MSYNLILISPVAVLYSLPAIKPPAAAEESSE